MKNPLISIIVPVYKVEHCLKRCVYSISNQTYKNLEIILVDDGSPDGCPALCDTLAKEDARIKVFHKTNGGPSSARNLGIKKATGEYICFVDSDDEVTPLYIEKLYNALVENDADVSICSLKSEREDGSYLKEGVDKTEVLTSETPAETFSYIYDIGLFMPPWGKLFKAKKLTANFREDIYYGEDEAFNLENFVNFNKIVVLEDVLYIYYINTSSITHKKQEELFKRRAESVETKFNLLKQLMKNDKLAGFYASKYLIAQAYSLIKEYLKDKIKTKQIVEKLEEMTSLESVQFALDIYHPMNKQSTFVCNCLKNKQFRKLIFASKIKMLIKKIIK